MKYIYEISSRLYLDKHQECYRRVVTINKKPEGPLQQFVKQMKHNKLSPFEERNNCNSKCFKDCFYALLDPCENNNCCNNLLCINDIGNLTYYLIDNNYIINTELSKMFIKNTRINPKQDLLFYIEYEV
jgi:hypothetical protein